jgi:hypothetical protein
MTSPRDTPASIALTDAVPAAASPLRRGLARRRPPVEFTVLRLGSPVRCADGLFGELADLIVFDRARRVTHLVVVPHHHRSQARLVPLELMAPPARPGREVVLRCTVDQLRARPVVQEYAYLRLGETPPRDSDEWDVGIEEIVVVPWQRYGALQLEPLGEDPLVTVSYDRIPNGAVEVRHMSEVSTADGRPIGRLGGLVIDDRGTVDRVIVERGHSWRRRRKTIAATAVAHFTMDGVTLTSRGSRSKVAAGQSLPAGSV